MSQTKIPRVKFFAEQKFGYPNKKYDNFFRFKSDLCANLFDYILRDRTKVSAWRYISDSVDRRKVASVLVYERQVKVY